jgi:hypothetical protein
MGLGLAKYIPTAPAWTDAYYHRIGAYCYARGSCGSSPNLIIANERSFLIRAITMAFVLRWAMNSIRRAPSPPMRFPASGFEVVNDSEVLDEERFEGFKTGRYYPVNIGDIFASKYQVIGKLGFGATSTVWLARDLR